MKREGGWWGKALEWYAAPSHRLMPHCGLEPQSNQVLNICLELSAEFTYVSFFVRLEVSKDNSSFD